MRFEFEYLSKFEVEFLNGLVYKTRAPEGSSDTKSQMQTVS
jgi:hypothetical protein